MGNEKFHSALACRKANPLAPVLRWMGDGWHALSIDEAMEHIASHAYGKTFVPTVRYAQFAYKQRSI
jgi:hypothetical protein